MFLFLGGFVFLEVISVAISVRCNNGKENYRGECECLPCWTGPSCDEKDNHPPIFDNTHQSIPLGTDYKENELIYVAYAEDPDHYDNCKDDVPCPCGEIEYSIITGNENDVFTIEPTLGIVRLNGKQTIGSQDTFKLELAAKNKFGTPGNSTMILEVFGNRWSSAFLEETLNGYDGAYHVEESHNRVKRAVGNGPPNVTFTLTKEPDGIVDVKAGQRIKFKLEILFPAGTTDMLVELFAPDNGSIVMMLCDVKIDTNSMGSNLEFTGPGYAKMESQNGSIFYDWAVIDFGNVTNDDIAADQHTILITYDAVTIQNENTVFGNTYWVSAGAEYNDESEVWVGQASFTARADDWNANTVKPEFNFSGPSIMEVGSSAMFSVEMYITYPSIGMSFDAFAPLNNTDVMTVCGVQIEDVGINYNCGFDYTSVPSSLHDDGQVKGNARGHLDIGVITNKGARDVGNPMQSNLIKVDFVVRVWDDDALGTNTKHWLGAAVELGSDQIWCGQIEVTVVPKTVSALTPDPTMTVTHVGNITEVSQNQPVVLDIELDIPVDNGDLILDVRSPLVLGDAVLQICALKYVSSGENLPCVEGIQAEYSSNGNDKANSDTAILNMGIVTNVGNWGYFNHSRNDTRNKINFRVLVKGVDIPAFTGSSSNNVEIEITTGGVAKPKVLFSVTTATTSSLPDITDTPAMNLTYKYSDGNVRVGQAVTMYYDTSTFKDLTFPVFDMEFIAPNSSGSASVSICRAEVITIGKNLPCMSKDTINSKFAYISQFGDNKNDRVSLSLGAICNFQVEDNSTEDIFVMAGVFRLENHPDATPGAQMYLSAGSMYTQTKMWVGQLSLTVDGSAFPVAPTVPQLFVNAIGDFAGGNTPIGYPQTYEITVKTVPGETFDFALTIAPTTAMLSKLSICSLKIKDTGYNLPCVDKTIQAVVTRDPTTGLNSGAVLTIGPVTNVGDDATDPGNSTFDANSLVLEVTMQSSLGAAHLENLPFEVILANSGLATRTESSLTVTNDMTGISTSVSNSTGITFTTGAVSNGDDNDYVAPGQVKRFFIDVNMPMNEIQKVTVKLVDAVATTGEFEIVQIGLSEVGGNLACLSREMTTASYTPRLVGGLYYDIGTIELGFVCNSGTNTVDPDANRIRVEAYARLLNNPTFVEGQTVILNAAVNFNDQQIYISQKDLTIHMSNFTDYMMENTTITNITAINVNSTTDPIVMSISEVTTIHVSVTVPAFTVTKVLFDVDLPMSTSASMTFKALRVVGSGQNLGKYGYADDYTVTEVSSQNTTQMNKAYVDMGIVSNMGFTQRLGTNVPEDDIIYLEVDVQMADSDTNVDTAELWMGLGFKVANFIVISDYKLVVNRLGTEKPVFNMTASYDSENSTSSYAEIDVKLSHDDTSNAEFQNTILKFNSPPYLSYKEVTATNPTAPQYTVNKISPNALEIHFGKFFFTDNLEMSVAFDVNLTYEVPQGILTTAGVTGVEVIANMIERIAPVFRNGSEEFTSGFMTVNGSYTTTSAGAGVACTPTINTLITGCQFTSSGDDIAAPVNALYTGIGWEPPVKDGKIGLLRYLQVNFKDKYTVTTIDYIHTKADKITKLKMKYSDDGRSWLDGEELILPAADGAVQVNGGSKSMYIRLYILVTNPATHAEVGLKVRFNGCYASAAPGSIPCPATPTPPPSEYIRRSFVTDSTHVYVCDGTIGKNNNIENTCFASSDGNNWTEMDSRVSCMVGHDNDAKEPRLYAVSKQHGYMTSADKGMTWMTVSDRRIPVVKSALTFTPAIQVPWNNDPLLVSGNAQFTQGTWQAKYEGMGAAVGYVNKFKWDSCC